MQHEYNTNQVLFVPLPTTLPNNTQEMESYDELIYNAEDEVDGHEIQEIPVHIFNPNILSFKERVLQRLQMDYSPLLYTDLTFPESSSKQSASLDRTGGEETNMSMQQLLEEVLLVRKNAANSIVIHFHHTEV